MTSVIRSSMLDKKLRQATDSVRAATTRANPTPRLSSGSPRKASSAIAERLWIEFSTNDHGGRACDVAPPTRHNKLPSGSGSGGKTNLHLSTTKHAVIHLGDAKKFNESVLWCHTPVCCDGPSHGTEAMLRRHLRFRRGTAAASRMASELEDMCALCTTCAHKNPKNASEPKLVRCVMRSRALMGNVLCAVYVSCIWCAVSENLYALHHTCCMCYPAV